jgi:hypothetical protein
MTTDSGKRWPGPAGASPSGAPADRLGTAGALRGPARRAGALAGRFALALFAFAPIAAAEDRPPAVVHQAPIDAAVERAVEWLMAKARAGLPTYQGHLQDATYEEIVLYALLHAGVSRRDPDIVRLAETVSGRPPLHTYTTAIRAQALALYDPVRLRPHILQSVQYLVDNQGRNGLWGYGKGLDLVAAPMATFTPDPKAAFVPGRAGTLVPPARADGPGRALPAKAPAAPRTVISRRGWGTPHDNSNTQYAFLGLAAGMSAGVSPPQDCLDAAERWLTDHQNEDGGWGYRGAEGSYGSMTAGGLSSLAILLRANGRDPLKDIRAQKALRWMGNHLTFETNPNKTGWHYYWIYAVERAGSAAGTDWFGDHPWFKEGAAYLLGAQAGDGSWCGNLLDTCWAVLFLRRATRHLTLTISGPGR